MALCDILFKFIVRTKFRKLIMFVVTVIITYNAFVLQPYNKNSSNLYHSILRKEFTKLFHLQSPEILHTQQKRIPVSCRKIIENDTTEIEKANKFMADHPPVRFQDEDFVNVSNNCNSFRHSMGYDAYPVTDEEREFPIAFSILTFKDVDQTERLLRAIYRPQNYYCIHVDKSSPAIVHKALRSICKCFDNVFIVSKTIDVVYNHVSRLQADINCMSDLLTVSKKWKYLINLPHQEFPLKTNLEMVKILKIYNGSNDIEGFTEQDRLFSLRYEIRFILVNNTWTSGGKRNISLPFNARITKGSAYGIFSREFLDFVLNSTKAKTLYKYMEDFLSPDEYYWASLNHNEVFKAPGRYTAPGLPDSKPWHGAYIAWEPYGTCHGKYVRGVCIFGVADLHELISKNQFFANKFYSNYQYLALHCLEEYIYNKTFSKIPIDLSYYRQLPFINK